MPPVPTLTDRRHETHSNTILENLSTTDSNAIQDIYIGDYKFQIQNGSPVPEKVSNDDKEDLDEHEEEIIGILSDIVRLISQSTLHYRRTMTRNGSSVPNQTYDNYDFDQATKVKNKKICQQMKDHSRQHK